MNRSAEHRLGSMADCVKLAGSVPGVPFGRFIGSMREMFLSGTSHPTSLVLGGVG